MAKVITKERQEQLSNRLVLNFGILLGAALIMLYVYQFLNAYRSVTLTVIGILGIISAVGAIVFFVLGIVKFHKLKNYSAIFLGSFIACCILYSQNISFITTRIPGFTVSWAVGTVYIAMAVYFIILAIVTAVQLKRPVVIDEKGIEKANRKMRRKKKKK